MLDSQASLGGTWAQERLYPRVKSNNLYGRFEFPDFPMDQSYGVKQWEHVPGPIVHEYLTDYARAFGVYERIRLNTWVESVEEITDGDDSTWMLQLKKQDLTSALSANKLIIACGLTSHPNMPVIAGSSHFNAPLFHSVDLAKASPGIQASKPANVVVLGASKSAWDAAYVFASDPDTTTTAHIIIRDSGNGPTWFAKPYATPLHTWAESLIMQRVVSWFSPCVFGAYDGYGGVRNFLQGTRPGRWLVNNFVATLRQDMIDGMGFVKDAETAKLKPETDLFFVGTQLAIDNYEDDFLELVRRGRIKVHRADVESLVDHGVRLSNGEIIPTDAMICCTGWQYRPPIKVIEPLTDKDMGLPYHDKVEDPLATAANEEIMARFPILQNQPKQGKLASSNLDAPAEGVSPPPKANTPMRLYKGMVPPAFVAKRNLGYIGYIAAITGPNLWHLQCLWLAAFLGGELHVQASQDEVEYETVLHSQWGKWRAPLGQGLWHIDLVLDQLPYCDMILDGLGLNRWRKGWVREWFESYGQSDYRNIIGEWMAKVRM